MFHSSIHYNNVKQLAVILHYNGGITILVHTNISKSHSSHHHAFFHCSVTILRVGRVQLKRDGTRWRTGGKVKGKLANGVGSQIPFTLPRNMVYPALLPLMRTPRLPVIDWTDAPANLNGLVRFAERRNLVSARVPSHFKRSLTHGPRKLQNVACTSYFPYSVSIRTWVILQ
jgi:hypothetical protein